MIKNCLMFKFFIVIMYHVLIEWTSCTWSCDFIANTRTTMKHKIQILFWNRTFALHDFYFCLLFVYFLIIVLMGIERKSILLGEQERVRPGEADRGRETWRPWEWDWERENILKEHSNERIMTIVILINKFKKILYRNPEI